MIETEIIETTADVVTQTFEVVQLASSIDTRVIYDVMQHIMAIWFVLVIMLPFTLIFHVLVRWAKNAFNQRGISLFDAVDLSRSRWSKSR